MRHWATLLGGLQLCACAGIDDRTLDGAVNGVMPFADASVAGGSGAALPPSGSGPEESQQSAEPGCPGNGCAPECPESQHACGTECADSSSPDSCGVSCAPCRAPAGGTATCANGQCGGACGPEEKLCAGACVEVDANCDASCPEATHDCGGLCADDFSVNSCGSSCVACPTPSNGQATCDGRSCGVLCSGGFHECDGQCVTDSSVDTCGTACEPCVAPTGGSVSCNGQACVPACPLGQQLCAGACLPSGAACNGQCPSGTHDCSGVCLANTAVNSCGASCTACASPGANGQASCDGVTCGSVCNAGFNLCSGGQVTSCSRNTFDFEGNFGVIRPDTIGTPPVTLASSRMARTGQFSAEMIVNIPSNAAAAARRTGVRLAVCGAQQSTNLRLPTLGTFYFIDGPAFPTGSRIHIGFESAARGEVEYRSFEPPPRNEWIDLSGRVTLNTSDVVAIKIWVSVPTGAWTGFVYFDDIRLAPE